MLSLFVLSAVLLLPGVSQAAGVEFHPEISLQGEYTDNVTIQVGDNAESDLISIVFSQTRDLNEANPASALREIGYSDVPLFCTQEPEYKGSMPGVIRVLVSFNCAEKRKVIPVYLDGAEALRTDIFKR